MSQLDRRQRWERLDRLLKRVERSGLANLEVAEVQELGSLYRQVAIDLSRARAGEAHPDDIRALNHLAARAHGQIYRARGVSLLPILMFLITGFPRVVRRHAGALSVTLGIFYGAALASFVAVVHEPSTAYSLYDEGQVEYENIRLEQQQGEYRGNFTFAVKDSSIVAAKIIRHNILVSLIFFACGALLGLPSVYVLVYNGRMLGTLEGLVYNHGFFMDFNALAATHGVFELTAFCVSSAGGFLLAKAIVAPGNLSRRDALKAVSRDAFGLFAGSVAMLVVAGIIESYVTPHFSQTVRWSVAGVSALFLIVYFGFVGRQTVRVANVSG